MPQHDISTYNDGAENVAKPERAKYESAGPVRSFLPSLYNRQMGVPGLVLYWPARGPMRPALLCRDEEAAALVVLLFSSITRCPGCRAPFTPGRADQEYCHRAMRASSAATERGIIRSELEARCDNG